MLSSATGCATLRSTMSGWERGPRGIALPQQRLREALSRGDFATALAWREDDALLRALTAGSARYYAAQYAESGAILDSASLLADDRITASVSKNALSLLTNDMARPYQPRRTERLFVAYYGMLSFAQLGAWEDAAVEARRMGSLIAQYQADRDDAERPLHAAMQYLAGAVFERAGEKGEAAVAYRIARAMASTSATATAVQAGDGEVLVVVERGFVAHRTSETISIDLDEEECDSIRSEHGRAHVAARLDERIEGRADPRRPEGGSGLVLALSTLGAAFQPMKPGERVPRHRHHDHDDDLGDRRLSIAFPALRRTPAAWGGELRIIADGGGTPAMRVAASVDDASAVDERRERLGVVIRAVARAAAKYTVTKAVKDKKGEVAGAIANLGANLLERADVRSWHLLPQELELVRLRVPAGTRVLWLEVGTGSEAQQLRIPGVSVVAGRVTIVPVRLWGDTRMTPVPAEVNDGDCAMFDCR